MTGHYLVLFSYQLVGGSNVKHHQLEAMLRNGEDEQVLAEAERYFAGGRGDPSEAVWVCAWACRSANRLERWGLVITWADRGLPLAGEEPEAEGILRFTVAKALMHAGDLLRAERELIRFRALAEVVPALRRALPDGLFNLAHLHRWLGRSHESNRLFRETAGAYEAMGMPLEVAQCHLEIGWNHLLSGALSDARDALDQVRCGGGQCDTSDLQTDLMIATALYCHVTGDTAESDRICESAGGAIHPRQAGEIAWIRGKNALVRGELNQAAHYLAAAHDAAVDLWWPPLLERVEALRANLVKRGVPAQ